MGDRLKEVVHLSREIVQSIWKRAARGESLNVEERRIADILHDHRQYEISWMGDGTQVEEQLREGMVNPFLHLHIHLIVEKQLREGDPPEVSEVASHLAACGMGRHEIIHSIGVVFLEEMYKMIRRRRTFDRGCYITGLKELLKK